MLTKTFGEDHPFYRAAAFLTMPFSAKASGEDEPAGRCDISTCYSLNFKKMQVPLAS